MTFKPGNRVITALDVPSREQAIRLAELLRGRVDWLKVGLELFIAEGPKLVDELRDFGYRIMLDLKLHDIPATVERATRRAKALGVELLTVHASGGPTMLKAAAAAAGDSLKILAVTVLTSMDENDLKAAGVSGTPAQLVERRAQLARDSGTHGVVCSANEAAAIRRGTDTDFLIVTPGVRPLGSDSGDQKRVATPAAARRAGADLIVVGRPIRDAEDPAAAAAAIVAELA